MNTLPNEIMREIIRFNNPNVDKMLIGKDRGKIDINLLCMYNILTPTRIEYVKSHFKDDDIIKIYDKQNKFIHHGIICCMLHKPNTNHKRSYKWKIIYNELEDESCSKKQSEFDIRGYLRCSIFNPQISLSLKKFNIVKCEETKNKNDIIMNYLIPYDIIQVVNNKRYKKDIMYLGDGVFIMCHDFFFSGGGLNDNDRLNRMTIKYIYPKHPNMMFKYIYKSQVNKHDLNALIEIDKIHPNITYKHHYLWSDYFLECVEWHKKYTNYTEPND